MDWGLHRFVVVNLAFLAEYGELIEAWCQIEGGTVIPLADHDVKLVCAIVPKESRFGRCGSLACTRRMLDLGTQLRPRPVLRTE